MVRCLAGATSIIAGCGTLGLLVLARPQFGVALFWISGDSGLLFWRAIEWVAGVLGWDQLNVAIGEARPPFAPMPGREAISG